MISRLRGEVWGGVLSYSFIKKFLHITASNPTLAVSATVICRFGDTSDTRHFGTGAEVSETVIYQTVGLKCLFQTVLGLQCPCIIIYLREALSRSQEYLF